MWLLLNRSASPTRLMTTNLLDALIRSHPAIIDPTMYARRSHPRPAPGLANIVITAASARLIPAPVPMQLGPSKRPIPPRTRWRPLAELKLEVGLKAEIGYLCSLRPRRRFLPISTNIHLVAWSNGESRQLHTILHTVIQYPHLTDNRLYAATQASPVWGM